MSTKNNTEYYVIDCDNFTIFELGSRINQILTKEVNNKNPEIIFLTYGNAEFVSFTGIQCVFYPNNIISICVGSGCIKFNCIHKILNVEITTDHVFKNCCVNIVVKIVDKNGGTV